MIAIRRDVDAWLARMTEPEPNSGCWIWLGSRNRKGYGKTCLRSIGRKTTLAHRAVYTLLRGPIPSDGQMDHLCLNKSCVNPDHLEVVDHVENMRRRRSPTCGRGHLYTPENTRIMSDGTRWCRACSRAYMHEYLKTYVKPHRRRLSSTPA